MNSANRSETSCRYKEMLASLAHMSWSSQRFKVEPNDEREYLRIFQGFSNGSLSNSFLSLHQPMTVLKGRIASSGSNKKLEVGLSLYFINATEQLLQECFLL